MNDDDVATRTGRLIGCMICIASAALIILMFTVLGAMLARWAF